jgi:SRSO17 transposase
VARALPASAWRSITWRDGSKGKLRSRFAAVRIWPATDLCAGREAEPESTLLIEWPAGEAAPTGYWLSALPADTPLKTLVQWAKRRHWIEQNYEEMKDELGLDHFEGRSWRGWHHHVTLTLRAFAFLVAEGYRHKKGAVCLDPAPSSLSYMGRRPVYGQACEAGRVV